MEFGRYYNLSYEELNDLEKKLHMDIFNLKIFNSAEYYFRDTNWDFNKDGADRLNNEWKRSTYWQIPKHYLTVKIKSNFKGDYKTSLFVALNEDFRTYLTNRHFENEVEELLAKNTKPHLKNLRENSFRKLNSSHNEIIKELEKLKEHLIRHINKNSVVVNKYEPHFMGSQDGRNTSLMIELIEGAKLAFNGIVCGNHYAYEWLLRNYINRDEVIMGLFSRTANVLTLSKAYLSYQIACEYSTKNQGPSPKATDAEIRPYIVDCIDQELIGRYSFITYSGANPGKVKHDTIAGYIFNETVIGNRYEDVRQIKDRVKSILPNINSVLVIDDIFIKKGSNNSS